MDARQDAPLTQALPHAIAVIDLDNDSWPDLYATNGMWGDGRDRDVELEFWWETLAYWDDYVAGTKTFDRKGAGVNGIERDRLRSNGRGFTEPIAYNATAEGRALNRRVEVKAID